MAKITPGAMAGAISGSIGSTTYSRNRFGPYMRNKAIPTNPNTQRQDLFRSQFSSLVTRFKEVLTSAQVSGWSIFSKNSPKTDSLGSSYTPTAINSYVSINSLLLLAGLSVIDDAPAISGMTNPINYDSTGFAISEATQILTITAAADISGFDPSLDDDILLLFQGLPKNPNVNYFGGPFRFIGMIQGNNGAPPAFPNTQNCSYSCLANQKTWIKLIHIDPNRLISPASIFPISVSA